MFLALDIARMEGSGLSRGMNCFSVVYLPDPTEEAATSTPIAVADDHPSKAQIHTAVSSRSSTSAASSSSSSIGRNSDSGVSSDPDDSGEPEVQSSHRGPLDTMDSLEDSLPMRRSISRFYAGKSKSFTSLSDAAAAAAAKDLAKPENPYNRKRKNLILGGNIRERNRHLGHASTGSKSGIAKRPVNFSRSSLALDAMGKLESSYADSTEDNDQQQPLPPFPPNGRLWPQSNHGNKGSNESPPQMPFASRSFSLFDLQGAASSASRREKHDKVFS